MQSRKACILMQAAFLTIGIAIGSLAMAQTAIVDQVSTVATANVGVPVEHDFPISSAGTYSVTVTDLGAQATPPAIPMPLASLAMAVTANDALVGTPVVVEGTGAPSGGTGISTINFTPPTSAIYPITYRIHVIGAPANGFGGGPISILVTNVTNNTTIDSWNDQIASPPQSLPSTEALFESTFSLTTSGNYQISIADLALPQTLAALTMILIEPSTGTAHVLPDPTNSNATQETVALAADSYQVYALGTVGTGATGGLFGISVAPAGGGASAYGMGIPVGTTVQLGAPDLSSGTYTLTTRDLGFPAPLSQGATMLLAAGQPVPLTIGGQAGITLALGQSGTFSVASTGTYQVFTSPTVSATAPSAGSFVAQIVPESGGAAVFGTAQAVTMPGGSMQAYSFPSTVPAAGTYTANLTDFQIPTAATAAELAVVQNGAVVGTPLTAPGSSNVNLTAAPVTLLAIAEAGAGGSLIDVNLANSSGSFVIDQPQGVGAAFTATQFAITTAGTYQFALTDLQWPAPFGQLVGVVTQGGSLIGEFFGGGALNAVKLSAGNYFVNIVATPASGSNNPDGAGTYVLNASQAPPAPVVNLTSDATTVSASGGTVHLIWTTSNASSCTASGGGWSGTFTGAEASSDSVLSPAITAATTFTLTCTGLGGTSQASVSVSIKSTSSGGGGALGLFEILALVAALVAGIRGRRRAV